MEFVIKKTYEDMSSAAADIIAGVIRQKPGTVIALPTGSTPVGTLEKLVSLHKNEGLDFSKAVSFNIDEYVPLAKDNPQGYYYYLYHYFYKHINIDINNTFVPDVLTEDVDKACSDYTALLNRHGNLDIIFLGIGTDGHIGFNLPHENKLQVFTHLQQMNEETIKANSRFFDSIEDVPKQAITMGIGNILSARKIVLVANGENKAQTIAKLSRQKTIETMFPASMLLLHDDVTVILDEAAAKLI